MIADQRIDGAVGQGRADRVAVALLAQRRRQAHRGIEVADVDVGQMQMVHAHVAGDRQALGLGTANQLDAGGTAQSTQMNPRAGVAHKLEDRVQRDRLGDRRHAREPHSRGQRTLRRNAGAEESVVRPQPCRVAEGRRVLQRAVQHQRVLHRHLGLREADAAGLGQLGHFG